MDQLYRSRQLTVVAYTKWADDMVASKWQPYFVNLMFDHLPRRHSLFRDPMEDEAERVYRTLVTRIVRQPREAIGHLPIFFGCPDFPVWKWDNVSRRDSIVNDGRHYNGLYFIPPVSRLRCSLGEHFKKKTQLYVRPDCPLRRLHVTPMNHGNVTDYALKAFKNGRIIYDDVLVLPRALSELAAQSAGA
jgi:hypothetical protein